MGPECMDSGPSLSSEGSKPLAEERLYENVSYAEARDIMDAMGRIPANPREDKFGLNVHCLFHSDTNPSAYISPNEKGDLVYMCFGCQVHKKPGYMLNVKRELGLMRESYTSTESEERDFDWAKQAKGENVHDLGDERRKRREVPRTWQRIRLRDYDVESQPQPCHGYVMPYEWAIFYPASVNEIHGPSESMKTWVALHCIHEAIKRGEHAAFIDFEDGAGPIVARLRAMGLDDDELDRLHYANPTEPLLRSDVEDTVDDIMEDAPSVVIVNGIIEALAVQGIDTNDNKGYTGWARIYTRPLADRGACVILIDHTSIKENASSSALGATAKMNIVQGASYLIEVGQEIAPAKNITTTGYTFLKLWKDRPGQVRQHGFKRRDVVAELHMEAHPGGTVRCTLEATSAITEDMLRDNQEHVNRDSCQRQLWTILVNWRGKGGIPKTTFVKMGHEEVYKIKYGRNQTDNLIKAWINGGFVEERQGQGATKLLVAIGDEFPDDRVSQQV